MALEGRTVVVTGASRGLGRAMAVALAAAGARVVLTGRDEAALAEAVAAASAGGATALGVALDLAEPGAADRVAAEVVGRTGGVDVVFANAGVSLVQAALETDDAAWDRIIGTNLGGTFRTCRAFGRHMLERGSGALVTVASDLGLRGGAGWSAYSASKAGIIGLSKSLAWEWAPTVTVNAMAPGAFLTDINRDLLSDPEVRTAVERSTPLGRLGRPEELGALAVYLASPAAAFMTGTVIPFDGGIRKS